MRLSGSRGSNLTRTGAHALVAISFSTTAVQTTLGSRGRIGTGSGVRAAFDPVWSTANRCFDGDARRKSQAIHLVWPLAPPLSKGIDRFLTQYPCHSPTPCPLCVKPGRAHAPCPCACARQGAEAGGRPQREREGPRVFARKLSRFASKMSSRRTHYLRGCCCWSHNTIIRSAKRAPPRVL